MSQAIFHFHGGLEYFLPLEHQTAHVVYGFDLAADGKVAVKHAVESLGIPHTEIDQIEANGEVVGFDYGLNPGDVIDVRAWTPKPDQGKLRPPLPRPVRFVLDTHLGRLAEYLRLLGIDTLYRNDYADPTLAEISHQEQRVLLTRDRGLLKRSLVEFGCYVRETDPKQQLISLLHHYQLAAEIEPWRRCLRCNALLEPVDKSEIVEQLEPKTNRYFDSFRRCVGCGQIYWRGSHYKQMQAFIEQVVKESARKTPF